MRRYQIEEWRSIPGWEGRYSVSDQGRVRRERHEITLKNGATRILPRQALSAKPTEAEGKTSVQLRGKGNESPRLVGNLVMEAFVGPRPPGKYVVHLNGCVSDNRLDNLTYGGKLDTQKNRRSIPNDAPRCSRGHAFHGNNLVMRAYRETFKKVCVACVRAQETKKTAVLPLGEDDLQATSDRFYREIMEAAA